MVSVLRQPCPSPSYTWLASPFDIACHRAPGCTILIYSHVPLTPCTTHRATSARPLSCQLGCQVSGPLRGAGRACNTTRTPGRAGVVDAAPHGRGRGAPRFVDVP